MNEHIELLVPVKSRALLNAAKIVLIIITVLGVLLTIVGFMGLLSLLIAVIAGVGAYFVGFRVDIEYEYALTAKELDVDVIFSKQKRKNVTTLDLTKLEVMAPVDSYRLDNYKNRQCKTEDFSSNDESRKKNMYVMYYDGTRRIVIEPDERLYKAIYNIAPSKVFNS